MSYWINFLNFYCFVICHIRESLAAAYSSEVLFVKSSMRTSVTLFWQLMSAVFSRRNPRSLINISSGTAMNDESNCLPLDKFLKPELFYAEINVVYPGPQLHWNAANRNAPARCRKITVETGVFFFLFFLCPFNIQRNWRNHLFAD